MEIFDTETIVARATRKENPIAAIKYGLDTNDMRNSVLRAYKQNM